MAEAGLGGILTSAGSALGGLGLFLLAVRLITDGLKTAAGHSLKDILNRATRSPFRGILAGLGITALVQSSSAVTVATIGFVNAGILSLYHSLGVIYGANVGTTMTGWLVAAVGFEFKLETFALPLVGLGVGLKVFGGESRRGAVGEAITGFGLFFVGLGILKTAFDGMSGYLHPDGLMMDSGWGLVFYALIGFLMTLVTQSSSAAIAITLTAASGSLLSLPAAAAMVIGANVGTTSTALLSVIGATPNAKRVAAAHLIFNLLTALVALLLLPVLLWVVNRTGSVLGLQDVPLVSLAMFHTVFNLLGVGLMLPVSRRLSQWLAGRFRTEEEIASRPKHLDPNVLVAPSLALNALVLETARVGGYARDMALGVLSAEHPQRQAAEADHRVVVELVNAIGDFTTRLQRTSLPDTVAEVLPLVLRTGQYYLEVAEAALEFSRNAEAMDEALSQELLDKIAGFVAETAHLISRTDPADPEFSPAGCSEDIAEVAADYRRVKEGLLAETARARLRMNPSELADFLEQLRRVRRMADQAGKGGQYLDGLRAVLRQPEEEEAPAADLSDAVGEGTETAVPQLPRTDQPD